MKRSICSLLLILCLLFQLRIPSVAASSMTTGSDGKAFIDEHQGGKSYNLAQAEASVNAFIDKYSLSLKQPSSSMAKQGRYFTIKICYAM